MNINGRSRNDPATSCSIIDSNNRPRISKPGFNVKVPVVSNADAKIENIPISKHKLTDEEKSKTHNDNSAIMDAIAEERLKKIVEDGVKIKCKSEQSEKILGWLIRPLEPFSKNAGKIPKVSRNDSQNHTVEVKGSNIAKDVAYNSPKYIMPCYNEKSSKCGCIII